MQSLGSYGPFRNKKVEDKNKLSTVKGFSRSLKKHRVRQPKCTKDIWDPQDFGEYAEKQLDDLSGPIFHVSEEINTALVNARHLPRKPNHWLEEARSLKCQASKRIQARRYNELKPVVLKILDHFKHCPLEYEHDKLIIEARMQKILDMLAHGELKAEQTSKPMQIEDVLEDKEQPDSVDGSVQKEEVDDLMKRDYTVPVASLPFKSEDMPTSETIEEGGASSQMHEPGIPEISLEDSNPPYIPEIQIEDIHESEISEEGSDLEDIVAKISSLPIQQEDGLHRRHEKMPISTSIDPNDESTSYSEAEEQPEMRVEKTSPELQIEMISSSQAQESKHLCESSARPAQTESSRLIHQITTISINGEMSESLDLKLEILSTYSSREKLNLNNYFVLDPARDNYFFSVIKMPVKLELDNQRTSKRDQQLSRSPLTSLHAGALLPDYMIVNKSGRNSAEMPTADEWRQARVINLGGKNALLLPEKPHCPYLVLLFFQRNNRLTYIPDSFFDHMPALRFLDLSNTRIRILPSSLFTLTELQVLMIRSCASLDRLPTEIENLRNMEVLDLWGTELYDLPDEIGLLTRLRHLQLSFYLPDDGMVYAKLPSELLSRGIISKLQGLQSLSIVVHPEDQRWIQIARDIVQDVGSLKMLNYLQFYFPTVEALASFIKMSPSWKEKRLMGFKFVLGFNIKRIISRVPEEVELKYDRHDQCLKFFNGNRVPEVVKTVLKSATAFYLDHHSEIQSLSEFGITNFEELKFCVVRECPNIQVIAIDEERSENAFPKLEHLGLHYLWELEKIWEDPVPPGSFRALKYLTVDTCPKLEYILSQSMLQCLSNLETFTVQDCESVKVIIRENQKMKHDTTLLPRLTELVLRHLPQLGTLGCGLSPLGIKVEFCPKLILNPQLGNVKRRKLPGSSCNCI